MLICMANPGAFIYNYGLWDAKSDNTFHGGPGVITFANSGTFRKSGGTGATTLDVNTSLDNSGLVDVESGTLASARGHSGGFYNPGNGTFNVASGTFLNFNGGAHSSPYDFGNDTTFSGFGIVEGSLSFRKRDT